METKRSVVPISSERRLEDLNDLLQSIAERIEQLEENQKQTSVMFFQLQEQLSVQKVQQPPTAMESVQEWLDFWR